VSITGIVLDTPGTGYTSAPGVAILDGTRFDPIRPGGTGAAVSATLSVQSVVLDTFGAGYVTTPVVTITDANNGPGQGAQASASTSTGTITGVTNLVGGSGYVSPGGIKKFVDGLPGLGEAGANNLGQYIPVAVPDTTTFPGADYYVIAVVQHRERMSSSLPAEGTLLREYVQLSTSVVPGKQVALQTDLKAGGTTPTLMPDGSQAFGVDDPHFLGPLIIAQKDRAVRITFYNLLPTGAEGDLFLPVDPSIMGSGMGPMDMMDPMDDGTVLDGVRNPMCAAYPKPAMCFKDNRATLHLHGGITPWISDGTPHQWITPADEATPWPQGVSVADVPDMVGQAAVDAGVPDCSAEDDGCQTFYYTNQQSARLMFYHDHAWGITRLNVYAGEAAGYVITDDVEQGLFGPGGPFSALGEGLPLVIQDRTFVPGPDQLALQDPTWDGARWGSQGDLWYHHVYMPAQNPGDPGGMSGFGRWMYGPWFWPPATPQYGPIANPYYDSACDPATAPDGFCEPELIPGTPNISAGMEQFNDTPIVNGTAYPTVTLDPTSYRLRILNAANDRFWNLQWYVGDPSTVDAATGLPTEVALDEAELAAAQTDPVVVPTPDTSNNGGTDPSYSLPGPDWVQIGTEGGFLPAPVVVDGQQVTTWITDPTRFDVGNVDLHSLLLAPAERADAIVDFSQFAGQTLILYNDAPAAFPARVGCYDYYTGGPDLTPACAPSTLPGYGPNTRTIMQVRIADTAPATPFDRPGTTADGLGALNQAFRHHANGSGVFESGQHPIIVGQAAYNSAYGTNFVASGQCTPSNTATRCDGYARIDDQGGQEFIFNTLRGPSARTGVMIEPKAIHDEMNSTSFDEFGRMTANLGVEAVPATPGLQNVTLYPFVNPQTELIDATNLPKGDVDVTPIAVAGNDGTQIWKITHNGVDTHPIHFHLYDVQVINRVTWDNIVIPPDATELGWKDTIRVSPLEDTIVALRPIIPDLPFEIPNSIRPLNPMMPLGSTAMFNNIDPQGNPTASIENQLANFGWEYVYHCHILSHEEMDMMRPVSVALPPNKPDGLSFDGSILTWNDNSINETSFLVQRSEDGTLWVDVGEVLSPLDQPNVHEVRTLADPSPNAPAMYRVVARNVVGYGGAFPSQTVKSFSDPLNVGGPAAPSNFTATLGNSIDLAWQDNSGGTASFEIERTNNGGAWVQIATPVVGSTSFVDTAVAGGHTYGYRLRAVGGAIPSAWVLSTPETVTVPAPVPNAPANLTAVLQAGPQVALSWVDFATNESGFEVERSISGSGSWTQIATPPVNSQSFVDTTVPIGDSYDYRVQAVNAAGPSGWSNIATVAVLLPTAPTNLQAVLQSGPQVALTWTDAATDQTGYVVQRSIDGGASWADLATLGLTTSYVDSPAIGQTYVYQVVAVNLVGRSLPTNAVTVPVFLPTAPTLTAGLVAGTATTPTQISLSWTDNQDWTGFVLEKRTNGGPWVQIATPSTTSFLDTPVGPGATYGYRVAAENMVGMSGWSNTATVVVPNLPAAPTNAVVSLQSGPRVRFAWRDNARNETGFIVERSLNGGAFSQIATIGPRNGVGNVVYLDAASGPGTFTYRVSAVNAAGQSAYATSSPITVPDMTAPSDLTGTAVIAGNRANVTLTWVINSIGQSGFQLQRATNAAFTTGLNTWTVGPTATSVTQTNLQRNRTYYYRIRARFGVLGSSAWSNVFVITTP
jgi:FtsP/CotA-like multicopper oxidase with cupredoxin domain/fibronectin type 3 domain-containing protein